MHCPNPACSYRSRFGRPGEYRAGFAVCTDCGAALVDGPIPVELMGLARGKDAASAQLSGSSGASDATSAEPSKERASADSDFRSRFLVTAVVALVTLGMASMPLLPVTMRETGEMGPRVSLLGIGLTPFLSAFVLVELAALAVPSWRALRVGSPTQRSKLTRVAFLLGCCLLLVQALLMYQFLTAALQVSDSVFAGTSWLSAQRMVVMLVASSVAAYLLAAWVSARGLSNGFSLVLLCQLLPDWVNVARELLLDLRVLELAAISGLVAALLWWLSRRTASSAAPPTPNFEVPISGTVPAEFTLVALNALAYVDAYSILAPYAWVYAEPVRLPVLLSVLVLDLTLVCGFLFSRPRHVANAWIEHVPGESERRVLLAARRLFPRELARSAALCLGVVLVPVLFGKHLSRFAPGAVLELAVAAAVFLDLAAELRWRRRGRHGLAWQVHRVYELQPVLLKLKQAGISAFARGLRHRALMQFLGPYVPIDVWVPFDRVEEAKKVLGHE